MQQFRCIYNIKIGGGVYQLLVNSIWNENKFVLGWVLLTYWHARMPLYLSV